MKQIKVPIHQNTLNKPHLYGLIYLQLIPVPALKRQGIKPGNSKTRECDKHLNVRMYTILQSWRNSSWWAVTQRLKCFFCNAKKQKMWKLCKSMASHYFLTWFPCHFVYMTIFSFLSTVMHFALYLCVSSMKVMHLHDIQESSPPWPVVGITLL